MGCATVCYWDKKKTATCHQTNKTHTNTQTNTNTALHSSYQIMYLCICMYILYETSCCVMLSRLVYTAHSRSNCKPSWHLCVCVWHYKKMTALTHNKNVSAIRARAFWSPALVGRSLNRCRMRHSLLPHFPPSLPQKKLWQTERDGHIPSNTRPWTGRKASRISTIPGFSFVHNSPSRIGRPVRRVDAAWQLRKYFNFCLLFQSSIKKTQPSQQCWQFTSCRVQTHEC